MMDRAALKKCGTRPVALAALVMLVLGSGWTSPVVGQSAAAQATGQQPPLEIVREVYVPYRELLRLAAEDPSGVVMTLDEYRDLVRRARENTPEKPEKVEPPPVEAAPTRGAIQGEVDGQTAVFRADFDIAVAAAGWVRCPLGPYPDHLGAAAVDGEPAWIVLETPRQKSKRPNSRGTPREMFAILRGVGTHRMHLEFSLPVREVDERWVVGGVLPRCGASRLSLSVKGKAEGRAEPDFFIARPEGSDEDGTARTVFDLAIGSRDAFELRWKTIRGEGRTEAVLTARHAVVYRLEPANPTVHWDAVVDVFRRRADRFVLVPPPGVRMLEVRGKHFHSFRILEADGAVEVLLESPIQGEVSLHLTGALQVPSPVATVDGASRHRFQLGAPSLRAAVRNRGVLGLVAPASSVLRDVQLDGLETLLPDAAFGEVPWGGPGGAPSLVRAYSFVEGGSLRVDVERRDVVFEARSTHRLAVDDLGGRLQSSYRIAVREGRLYTVELTVPAALELVSMEEPGALHGARLDPPPDATGPTRTLRVHLNQALRAGATLLLNFRFDGPAPSSTGAPPVFRHTAVLPRLNGAAREGQALFVETPGRFLASIGSVGAWRALPRGRSSSFGESPVTLPADVVAALEAEFDGVVVSTPIEIDLRPRPVRGVYQAVIHTQVAEERMRVRAELRLVATAHPVEAIGLVLPVALDAPIRSTVPDGKPIEVDTATRRRVVRFQKPWLGERRMRFEFDQEFAPQTATAVPVIELVPLNAEGEAVAGVFDSSRFVVFGAFGGVELEVTEAAELSPADVDDLPAFAELWSEGRLVRSYRVDERQYRAGQRSTFLSTVHARSPVLRSGISVLNLETAIGRGGVSRTTARCILRYSREQSVTVELGPGTKLLAAEVDGHAVEPLQELGAEAGTTRRIPLPPRAYATLRLVYEREGEPWMGAGSWEARGPSFGDIPVGEVRWDVYYPPGLEVDVRGESVDSISDRRVLTFAQSFWGRIFSGRWPRWTAWEEAPLPLPTASSTALAAAGAQPPASESDVIAAARQASQQLVASETVQQEDRTAGTDGSATPGEGVLLRFRKLGGSPRVLLNYAEPTHSRSIRRAVFILAVVIGLGLLRSGRRRAFWPYVVGGLAIATFLPAALGLDSPYLWMPFAEGLSALVLGCAVVFLVKLARRPFSSTVERTRHRWRAFRLTGRPTATVAILVSLSTLAGAGGRLAARESDPLPVLIPYDPDSFDLEASPQKRQVYVPYATFVELWNLAYPDDRIAIRAEDLPAELVLGNASYRLDTDEKTFRIRGTIDVRIFTREWTAIPLPVSGAELSSISVDGVPTGVSHRDGVPFVAIRGEGEHRIDLEIEGKVELARGEASISAGLVAALCTRLEVTLPAGVDVESTGGPDGVPVHVSARPPVENGDAPAAAASICRLELGSDGRFELRWRSRTIDSEQPARLSELSESGFFLERDGYRVRRRELVRVEGAPVKHLRFTVGGRWHILSCTGRDLTDWSVTAPADGDGQARELEVIFARAGQSFEFEVTGFAPCGVEPVEAASLSLAGAVSREGFIGLKHDPGRRRFPIGVLDGLDRATTPELRAKLPVRGGDDSGYDRVFRFHDTYSAQRISTVPEAETIDLTTELVGIVDSARISVAARVRYDTFSGVGGAEYRTTVPDPWSVRVVRGPTVLDWEVEGTGANRQLVVRFRSRPQSGAGLEWHVERPPVDIPSPGDAGATVDFPGFRAVGVDRQWNRWSIAAASNVSIEVPDGATNLSTLAEGARPEWLQLPEHLDYKLGFHSRRPDPRLRVTVRSREVWTSARSTTVVRVSGTHVDVNTRFRLTVERTGLPAIQLRLPVAVDESTLTVTLPGSSARRELQTTNGVTTITLTPPSPLIGIVLIDLAYRVPRAPDDTRVSLGVPRVASDQAAESYLALLRSPLHRLRVVSAEGLTPVGSASLVDLPQLTEQENRRTLTESYQLVSPDAVLVLDEDSWLPRPEQNVVELVELDTVLAADGSNWTEAAYTIHNRTLQFFEFEMPEAMEEQGLWRVTVDGRPVSVSRKGDSGADARTILVPVERLVDTDLSLDVRIVYTLPRIDLPAASSAFRPVAPRLLGIDPTRTFATFWRVHVPAGYEVTDVEGNLSPAIEQTRHGNRVQGLLNQIERLKVAGERAGTRGKLKVEKNLLQLKQALSDSVAEIERGAALPAQRPEIESGELRKQLDESRASQKLGQDALKELEQREAQRRDADGQTDPVEQSFEDAWRFNENRWTSPPAATKTPAPPSGTVGLERFRGDVEFAPIPSGPSLEAAPAPPLPFRPPPDGDLARWAPLFATHGVTDVAMPRGGQVHTYRRDQGNPELEVTLANLTHSGRWMHGFCLLVSLAAIVLWWRMAADRRD